MDDPMQQVPNTNPSQPVSQPDMPGGVQTPPVEPVEPVQQPEPSVPVSDVETPVGQAETPQAGGMQ